MTDHDNNGGGYGTPGAEAQSAQQAAAQKGNANPTPSSQMAKGPEADGSVATMAGMTDGDSSPRPNALNAQSQIAYDAEEE